MLIVWILYAAPALASTTTPSASVAPAASALELVRQANAAAEAVVHRQAPSWSPEADVKRHALERVLDGAFDFREIARRCLPARWTALSEPQRAQLTRLLRRLVARAYLDHWPARSAHETTWSPPVGPPEDTRVQATRVDSVGGETRRTKVEYQVVLEDGRWRIVDVLVSGQGLVEGYRRRFAEILAKESFDGLLTRIRDKLDDSD
jgi:phospholipid transport system substrate-binding protein